MIIDCTDLYNELKIKAIKYIFKTYDVNDNIDLKYKLKKIAVELSLEKLSTNEVDKIMKCVNQAISFWSSPVNEKISDIDDEECKKERLAEIDKFRNYLTLNTLYQLVVKNEEYVYIHKSWEAMENLAESVRDSGVLDLYMPVKTHMHVYRDKVMLGDRLYYDSVQNDAENLDSMDLSRNKTKLKSIYEYVNLFSNNR